MRPCVATALVIGAIASMAVPAGLVKAEPLVLTPSQLEKVTAAGPIPDIIVNLNLNTTVQVATATGIATAICVFCESLSAGVVASSSNFNFNFQRVN